MIDDDNNNCHRSGLMTAVKKLVSNYNWDDINDYFGDDNTKYDYLTGGKPDINKAREDIYLDIDTYYLATEIATFIDQHPDQWITNDYWSGRPL